MKRATAVEEPQKTRPSRPVDDAGMLEGIRTRSWVRNELPQTLGERWGVLYMLGGFIGSRGDVFIQLRSQGVDAPHVSHPDHSSNLLFTTFESGYEARQFAEEMAHVYKYRGGIGEVVNRIAENRYRR